MKDLVLIAGESNAGCLVRAARTHRGAVEYRAAAAGREATFSGLTVRRDDGQRIANPAIMALLKSASRGTPPDETTVLSVFGGNYAHTLVLAHHGRGLALAAGFRDGEPVDTDAYQFVPESFAAEVMERMHEPLVVVLQELRQAGYKRVLHLEGPPPVRDAAFMLDSIKSKKQESFWGGDGFRINAAPQRLAFWRLQAKIARQICERLGVVYVAPPDDMLDKNGYLARRAWHDALHGNVRYGASALAKIERTLALA